MQGIANFRRVHLGLEIAQFCSNIFTMAFSGRFFTQNINDEIGKVLDRTESKIEIPFRDKKQLFERLESWRE